MGREIRDGKHSHALDFPAYAQEFLRRNPDYRKQYTAMEATIAQGASTALQEVMALKWGLSFPGCARP